MRSMCPPTHALRLLRRLPRLRGRDREGAPLAQCLGPLPTLPRKRGRECGRRARLASLASVFHAGRGVDLADDAPILLVGDRDEAVLGLELGLERRALPREAE